MNWCVIVLEMRMLLLIAIAACGSTPDRATSATNPAPTKRKPRMDLHCTPGDDFDEPACSAKGQGCSYGPPLICRGVEVDEATHQKEQRRFDAGTDPCTCICEDARLACSMVP
jgi:hypothetical protein